MRGPGYWLLLFYCVAFRFCRNSAQLLVHCAAVDFARDNVRHMTDTSGAQTSARKWSGVSPIGPTSRQKKIPKCMYVGTET